MSGNANKLRIQFVVRPIPKYGPSSTEDYNASVEELSIDLTSIAEAWNQQVYPILSTLPQGTLDDRWDLPASIDPFTQGMDGSNIFMHNSASATTDSGRFWDSTNSRPKTIREVSSALHDDLDTLREDLTDSINSISSGLTSDQWTRLGYWVRDGGTDHGPAGSIDYQLQSITDTANAVATDIYDPAGSLSVPGTRLNYTVETMLSALLSIHGGAWDENPNSGAYQVDHGTLTGIVQTGVDKSVSTTPLGRSAPLSTLEDDMNRLRYEVGRTRTGDGSGSTEWRTGVSWPSSYKTGEINLHDHVNDVGSGTPSTTNPHGLDITNIDSYDVEPGYIRTFIGKSGVGSETPTYSSTNHVTQSVSLEVAIGELDAAIETKAVRKQYTFSSHTNVDDPVVINHNMGVIYPLVQVIDTTSGDKTGVLIDEVYTYELERGLSTTDAFLSIEFVDENTLHVYTSATDGVVVAVF